MADQRHTRTPPSPHTLKLLVAPVIFLVVVSRAADVTWSTLHDTHPLLLIAMSSINRYLILVSDQLDPVSYYGVGTLRLLLSDPLFFLLGYWYGDRALDWIERKSPTYGPMLRSFETTFAKAAWPLILLAPNNFICLFAGAAGMPVLAFFAVNLVGTIGRLYLIRVLGSTFDEPIEWFRDFAAEYRWPLLGVSALVVGWSVLRDRRSGGGEIDTLLRLDEDLAEPALEATEVDPTEPHRRLAEDDPGVGGHADRNDRAD